jgi:hypothetical protein
MGCNPVARNFVAPTDPNIVVLLEMIHKPQQASEPAGMPDKTRV